jgi:hypothetical protein
VRPHTTLEHRFSTAQYSALVSLLEVGCNVLDDRVMGK